MKMVDIENENFDEELEIFGFSIEDDDVYDKMRQLCQVHKLDAGQIVNEWVAFAAKHNIKLTSANLEQLDREKLNKKQLNTPKTVLRNSTRNNTNLSPYSQTGVNDVLESYATPNSKNSVKRQHTPDNPVHKKISLNGNSAAFSPSSFSPNNSVTPSKKYSSRSNIGQVVCSWGTNDKVKWKSQRENAVNPKLYKSDDNTLSHLIVKDKYMFQKLSDKALVLNDLIEEMGEFLRNHHNISEDFSHLAKPVQDSVSIVGRICCDTVGKINAQSTMLEGSRETSAGMQIKLDLSEVNQFSLFPGQILACEGINSSGDKMIVKKFYENASLPLPEKGPVLDDGQLSVVVTVGPYTTTDNVMYEPLGDLLKYLHKETPDVCIMMGPFIDSKQADIEELMTDLTFEQFFEKKIVEVLAAATSRLKTSFVFVPSFRDIHHEYIYPQPPFVLSPEAKTKLSDDLKNNKIQFVSDPCTLDINGLIVGLTSTDLLFHLGHEETSSNVGGDRLTRLTQHILNQHNYYPLYPPHEDMCVDYDQFDEYSRLPCTPHVFIVPSDLRYFIKDIQGCCCINPGRLTKGQVGGTYTRFVVNSNKISRASVVDQISAQVVRI